MYRWQVPICVCTQNCSQCWRPGNLIPWTHCMQNTKFISCGRSGKMWSWGSLPVWTSEILSGGRCGYWRSGAFSLSEGNHIYNIARNVLEGSYFGCGIAGIKLHAGIDTIIRNNVIHTCLKGVWLDWQAQGSRITRNIFLITVSQISARNLIATQCIIILTPQ